MQQLTVDLELKKSQESLEFALKSGRMGTWDINLLDDTLTCSQEMLLLWNITKEEFKGHRSIFQSKVHVEDLEKMVHAINTAIKDETIYELEYRIHPTPETVRWVTSRGRCTYAPNTKSPVRFSGVVWDITERKEKEEELARANKIKEQLFLIASHELRTPLTCLNLQLEVMEWDLKHRGDDKHSLSRLHEGIKKQKSHLDRIGRIIDNILDEAKILEGRLDYQFEHFNLCDMTKEIVEQFQLTAESAGVRLSLKAGRSVMGNWDRFRLEQVLLNLLSNAIRYGERKPVEVEVIDDNNFAYLIIKDHGRGIKKEDQQRIFNRFERVFFDSETSGMGLGLFISNSIVKNHGGEIQLKSELGNGSEFKVILPKKYISR